MGFHSEFQIRTMKVITTILVCCALNFAQGQQAFSATGGEASGSGGSNSYTVGQLVYTTKTDSSGTLNEGVQQTYTVENSDGLDENLISLAIDLFPNPSSDIVNLQIEDVNNSQLSYTLTDVNGKLMQQAVIDSELTSINLEQYAAGIYFIKI